MNVFDSNILRAAAKAVVAECKEELKGVKPMGERDKIKRAIIDKHYRKIDAGYTKLQLIYMIGVVRGILRDPR